MRKSWCLNFTFLAILILPAVPAYGDGIEGWIADSLATEILDGIPGPNVVGTEKVRIAVQPFPLDETPISVDVANELNAALLSALIRKSEGRHVFVARGALKSLVRDVSNMSPQGPQDPVERLLENARGDILVVGTLRRADGDVVLAYKAVTADDGAVLASTKSYRLQLRDADLPQASLNFDQALPAAAKYLVQRVDGLERIIVGDVLLRSESAETSFAAYVRDRMVDELRRASTNVLTGADVDVTSQKNKIDLESGEYRLIGNYWPLGETVELSLSLQSKDGVAVTWRERVQRRSIPATLALGPEATAQPAVDEAKLPWLQTRPRARFKPKERRVAGRKTVAQVQRMLHALGYNPGPVNGFLSPRTRRAIAAFQRRNGLGADGRMTRALFANLRMQSR